ncbi:MAG: alanine--tRNA ligase [Defluviitaleaceae bacterium]|nr:alanine--tRNA ligase [Defluviitaleaceae bacterium]
MLTITYDELREKFLSFFESKGHLRLPSFSLVPRDDKSILLINAGMTPMKPFFSGAQTPPRKRVATCQKCVRTIDIDEVGDLRHFSFFEMLGNFSFGDYFKEDAIPWAWEFITEVCHIPPERLYVSVYKEDDEAYDIWAKKVGFPEDRIYRFGMEDNFWGVDGYGPCGPCSEIFFDKGEKYGCGSPDCAPGCDCDRYLEFWDLVFTQFDRKLDGSLERLKFPNIDTGMSLERLAVVTSELESVYDAGPVAAVRARACEIAGYTLKSDPKKDSSITIITDHIRSVSFLTADGVMPSNEGRGYILRRLLRRAARHGKLLGIENGTENGIKGPFLAELSRTVVEAYGGAYPELRDKSEHVYKVISIEEKRFSETLDQGLEIMRGEIDKLRKEGRAVLLGEASFRLYDTFGFPLELMGEIAKESGISIDEEAFETEMEKQRRRARAAREETGLPGAGAKTAYDRLDASVTTEFVGYGESYGEPVTVSQGFGTIARVLAIISGDEIVEKAEKGAEVTLFLDKTPFYAESGGQKGDFGLIDGADGAVRVDSCVKINGKTAHIGEVTEGFIETGAAVTARINAANRMATSRNHSATHLLQAALRQVLGNHVEQAGSSVDGGRLRFDFTHYAPISHDDLERVEKIVNEKILEAIPIDISQKSLDEARKMGATALFGEKYGDVVRVVKMGDFSLELCGGTHLGNTSQAGLFKIVSETGVAAGIRRIEALTGFGAKDYYDAEETELRSAAALLKTTPEELEHRVAALISENRQLRQEAERSRSKAAAGIVDEIAARAEAAGNFKIASEKLTGVDAGGLRDIGDRLRDKIGSGVVILACVDGDKVNFLVTATDDAVKAGAHAGNLAKEAAALCGGGGGGKPGMAQAGGKDASKADEALKRAVETAKGMVKG